MLQDVDMTLAHADVACFFNSHDFSDWFSNLLLQMVLVACMSYGNTTKTKFDNETLENTCVLAGKVPGKVVQLLFHNMFGGHINVLYMVLEIGIIIYSTFN